MRVCLSFWEGDSDAALKLLEWVRDMGSVKDHDLLMTMPPGVDTRKHIEASRDAWKSVTEYAFHDRCESGWPFSANHAFKRSVEYIEFNHGDEPFLWLESDSIPLRPEWLNDIDAEYRKCGKRFMGAHARKGLQGEHMNGVGIWCYPSKYAMSSMLAANPQGREKNLGRFAFDQVAGDDIIPQLHESKLFQFLYRSEDKLWEKDPSTWLESGAAIFHTEKTGKLIDWLREKACVKRETFHVEQSDDNLTAPRSNTSHDTSRRVVKTFYDPLDTLHDAKLMELWCDNWRFFGWEPEIVDLQAARKMDGRRYKLYEESHNLYKGNCSEGYLFRCYARWLTMLNGGLMVDFDVFNYGFTPEIYDAIYGVCPKDKVTHLSGDSTPCATFGAASAYENYVSCFDLYDKNPNPSTPHLLENVHDLNILDAHPEVWFGLKLCSLYPDEASWKTMPLVHYTHGRVPYPRSNVIPGLRKLPDTCEKERDEKASAQPEHGQSETSNREDRGDARAVVEMLKAGQWVVEAGASNGTHSRLYSEAVKPSGVVMAFEPNQEARERLKRNVNGNVDVYPFALGDNPETVEGIETRTLDSFVIPRLNLIKLNVEGGEERALRGALKHIRRHRPIIVAGIKRGCGTSVTGLKELLAPLNYECKLLNPECTEESEQFDVIFRPGRNPIRKKRKPKAHA